MGCTHNRNGKLHEKQLTRDERKLAKREMAEERVKSWRKLTPQQQLTALDNRGNAKKQRQKIATVIATMKGQKKK